MRSEDGFEKIINLKDSSIISKLEFTDTSIGWTEIIKLIRNDYSIFSKFLIFCDPDVAK